MRYLKVLLALMMVVGIASIAWAIPVTNTAGDGIEDFGDGSVYGFYQNSGVFLDYAAGNNLNSFATVVSIIQAANPGLTVTVANNVTYTPYDNNSGTWESSALPPEALSFYAVKAGDYFAMYEVDPADSTGSYSTFDIWSIGGPGTGGRDGLQISHFTGYNPSSVPEPSTLILLGLGLCGVVAYSRKRLGKS